MAEPTRATPATPSPMTSPRPGADAARRTILGRLRTTLARADLRFPPANPPELTAATRMAVTSAPGGAPELAARFAAEMERLHGACEIVNSPAEARLALINRLLDWRSEDEAAAKGMRVKTDQERMVLGWQSDALPLEHVAEALADMGMRLVTPIDLTTKESRESVRQIRYGLTGAEAAFAATGSLLLASTPQTLHAAGLLPLRHIALVPFTRLFANVEAWLADMRLGDLAGWMRSKPNVTLITGPSKSADIEMILTLGVHGPKFVHVILFDDGIQDDETQDSFWRYVPGGPPSDRDEDEPPFPGRDEGLLPAAYRPGAAPDMPAAPAAPAAPEVAHDEEAADAPATPDLSHPPTEDES